MAVTFILMHPLLAMLELAWFHAPEFVLWCHVVAMTIAVLLMLDPLACSAYSLPTQTVYSFLLWMQFPAFYSWLWLTYPQSDIWFLWMVLSVMTYYWLTDWRLANVGVFVLIVLGASYLVYFHLAGPTLSAVLILGLVVWSAAAMSAEKARQRFQVRLMRLGQIYLMAYEVRPALKAIERIVSQLSSIVHSRLKPFYIQLRRLIRELHQHLSTMRHNSQMLTLGISNNKPLDVTQIVTQAIKDYAYRGNQERAAITCRVRHYARAMGNAVLLEQVIHNLLKNCFTSLASTNTPLTPGSICVDIGQFKSKARILITDQGLGMDHRVLGQAFFPFVTTDPTSRSGIGLSFCRAAIRAMNGVIKVQSVPAHGALFMIEIPLCLD